MPRLLDLFCGIGGCSVGYQRAGFDVTGVDWKPQPRYPILDVIQGDALVILTDRDFLAPFDVIHASPPCQAYTRLRSRTGRNYPDLVGPVRDLLVASGKPYVIENVPGAPLLDPVTLCGSMFGLGVFGHTLRRHRLFESNVTMPPTPADDCTGQPIIGVNGTGGAWVRKDSGGGGIKASGRDAATALGIDWTDHQPGLAQAIPPAYTQWIGATLLAATDAQSLASEG
jgi:DNA (cytosine-5)-methyltransferase 1